MENKYVMVIGHPGHELRAFNFLKKYKPDVYILTTGWGSFSESRLNNSIEIIEELGGRYIPLFKTYTDREIYKIFLQKDFNEIQLIRNSLKEMLLKYQYNFVIGDALEGFNPTHDFCRYLINSIVKDLNIINFQNYDLLLDSLPKSEDVEEQLVCHLDEQEFEMKYQAATNYGALKFEVDTAINKYGKEAFATEYFRKVSDLDQLRSWTGSEPLYEKFGRERVKDSVYSDIITYENHLKPIAKFLLGI